MPSGKHGTSIFTEQYKPEYAKLLIDFCNVPPYRKETLKFEKNGRQGLFTKIVPADMPFYCDWKLKYGIAGGAFHAWCSPESPAYQPEFKLAHEICEEIRQKILILNTLANRYNPFFATFIGKNLFKWVDAGVLKGEGFENKTYIFHNIKGMIEDAISKKPELRKEGEIDCTRESTKQVSQVHRSMENES